MHRWLSSRGAAELGRYRTARAPYLREIMDALSPRQPRAVQFKDALPVKQRVPKCDDCPDQEACRHRRVFGQVFWSYLVLIESLTMADLVERPESGKSATVGRQIGI